MSLLVVGSLNLDLVGWAPRIPAPGETVLGTLLQRFHGGKGGNQAVAAARAGASVRFIGAVGRDASADELLKGLQAEGIDTSGVVRVDEPSGTALITVNTQGENAITVLPGANARVPSPAHASFDVGWLLLQLEIPVAVNEAWARAARASGGRVMMNAAPVDEGCVRLLDAVDLLLVNEGEALALAARVGSGRSGLSDGRDQGPRLTLQDAVVLLARQGPGTVVVTLGDRGCLAYQRDAGQWIERPARAVRVVDTTGAGDTFAGALAVALDEGQPIVQALDFAGMAAALSCTAAGARGGMPRRADIEAGLRA